MKGSFLYFFFTLSKKVRTFLHFYIFLPKEALQTVAARWGQSLQDNGWKVFGGTGQMNNPTQFTRTVYFP